jgi:hypothetical protein
MMTGTVATARRKASFDPGVSIRPVSMRGMPDRPSFTSRQK